MPSMLTELEREKLQRVHRHKNKYSKCEFDVYQVEKQDKFILQFCCMKEKQLRWYRNEERMLLLRCSLITNISPHSSRTAELVDMKGEHNSFKTLIQFWVFLASD